MMSAVRAEALRVWKVSEITEDIKEALEDRYPTLWIEGELSNFTRASSGHCYFTLKDDDAQLNCVMWRWDAERLHFSPEDGMQVRARGDISVYPPRGQYQLQVQTLRPAGEGELYKAFQKLKKKLQQEGLFAEEKKKDIPDMPRRVGVVTSGTGAAIHDILTTLDRRFPAVKVLHCPVRVQGDEATSEVVAAIEAFNGRWSQDNHRVDVLIVGRGGGSTEDLWTFNEESVTRAVFASSIPIISAVGHESDVSITDLVADVRAATPSMAAEIAVPDQEDVRQRILDRYQLLRRQTTDLIRNRKQRIRMITQSHTFRRPVSRLQQTIQRVDELQTRLQKSMERYLEQKRREVDSLEKQLNSNDPNAPLRHGFVRVERDGDVIKRATSLAINDSVKLHFQDGTRSAEIRE